MMGYIGKMENKGTPTAKAALPEGLRKKTQKTIMFDPFYEKALN